MRAAAPDRERGAALLVAPGPRAAEAALLGEVFARADEAERDPRLLRNPVLVVVPSASLREHVAARLVAGRARALAGVEVLTLYRLAARVLEAAGEPAAGSDRLLAVLARRFGRREDLLRAALDPLRDGWRVLAASLRDFLDAGFQAEHADACVEAVRELGTGPEVERAAAIVRVAAAVAATIGIPGLGRRADVMRRAALVLRERGAGSLGARAVLVHGFAETTAVAGDLLVALVRVARARVFLDEPADPTDAGRSDPGVVFAARLRERLEAWAPAVMSEAAPPAPAVPLLVRAAGASAEAREVGRRVRALLGEGVAPESIGVVARDLGPYESPIARHFGRLAIPFAVRGGAGSAGPGARRLRALRDLLERGPEASTDAFLSAWTGVHGAAEVECRVGLLSSGAARLGDVARLDADALLAGRLGLPLPLVKGEASDEVEAAAPPRRRLLWAATLRRLVEGARGVVAGLEAAPERAPLGRHLEWLRGLLAGGLLWRPDDAGAVAAEGALAELEADLPAELAVEREEFALLTADALAGAGAIAAGGEGGGVQVLSVMEARSRTFAHLFVVGLNREAFPRVIVEDPLLPDRLRAHLALRTGVLTELPVKGRGRDEERYLFAQLVAASPAVTLSWQVSDDDGKARSASPLVERVCLAQGPDAAQLAADPWDSATGAEVRPAHEQAVLAGLLATRARFAAVLATALAEGGLAAGDAAVLAESRVRSLDELDPDRRLPDGRRRSRTLGPWFGFVGAARHAADRRRGELWVTLLEGMAACPWQAFLRSVLRLEPPPDPLAALPTLDPRVVGKLVHRVLQRVAGEETDARPDLAAVLVREAGRPPWPGAAELAAIVQSEAERLVRETGLAPAGLAALLAARAGPALEVARQVDWGEAPPHVLGAEVSGSVAVGSRTVRFVADRVDAWAGGVRLSDYKTAAPLSDDKKAETRARKLREAIGAGRRLQAVAYAHAVTDRPAEGRYVHLRPQDDPEHRVWPVAGDDRPAAEAFLAAAETVLAAWDEGAFLPRLVEQDGREEYLGCRWCEVWQACLRHDSGALGRVAAWTADEAAAGEERGAAAAARQVWMLAAKPRRAREGGQ